MPPRKSTSSSTSRPATPAAALAPAPARSAVKGSGTSRPATRQPTHDEIAGRAYRIYASRGYAPGDPNADWHEAERQLKAGL